MLGPLQQVAAVSVRTKAGEVDNSGTDGDLFPEKLDRFCTFQQTAAERALCLIAHEDDGAFRSPEIVLEMVTDTACVTHARGRDNDFGGAVFVQGTGLLGGVGEGQAREGK